MGHAVGFGGLAAEFGSERAVADARHQSFGDADSFAVEVWRKVAAGVSGRGGGAAGSNKRDGAFINIEHEGLGAFEEDGFAVLDLALEIEGVLFNEWCDMVEGLAHLFNFWRGVKFEAVGFGDELGICGHDFEVFFAVFEKVAEANV